MQDEQEVLEGVADWFRSRLEQLERLEYYHERRLKRLNLLDDDGRSTFEVRTCAADDAGGSAVLAVCEPHRPLELPLANVRSHLHLACLLGCVCD